MLIDYILVYIFSGFMGWLIEKYYFIRENPCGDTMNKKFLNICIPFLHVWAIGGIITIAIYNSLPKTNIFILSLLVAIVLSIFECVVGQLSYKINGHKTWEYEPYKCVTCNGFVSLYATAHWYLFALLLLFLFKFYKLAFSPKI